jgi:hypothetical protein
MRFLLRLTAVLAMAAVLMVIWRWSLRDSRQAVAGALKSGTVLVARAAAHDVSRPLALLRGSETAAQTPDCAKRREGCGTSPGVSDDPDDDDAGDAEQVIQPQQITPPQNAQRPAPPPAIPPTPPPIPPAGLALEQHTQGTRPAAVIAASFDGMGFGFTGPQGQARNAALDNSLAVGPNHIVQVINGAGIAIYTKKGALFDTTGKVLYGAVASKTVFQGFGGACEAANFGDVVARYDQFADRWLYVMPIFQRIPGRPEEPYSVCYAVSQTPDPMGAYYRYEFRRKLFPDYPRPAIWPDGYYVPSSTGDNVIQKHACIVDRAAMLKGKEATEQCLIIDGVNFLNNADIDGPALPPSGTPNIMMAAGGSQLRQVYEDDGIYFWKLHVDWENPKSTAAVGPTKIPVAPYHYLCNGQLTNCVPQPGTTTRLDAQGDKLMQRLTYRNFGDHQSIVVTHSIDSSPGAAGGVRWYEFRLDPKGDPYLYQQGTYAPDDSYRWMASAAMDRTGNIGIGYSFGGTPNFVGQRFAARMAADPLGQLSFHETVLASGQGVQARGNRWTDYATTAMDPSDDCTFWYVGDYFKEGAALLTTKIGGFRLPGCLQRKLNGSAFFDANHNGKRDAGETGLPGIQIAYSGGQSGKITTGNDGSFSVEVPADPLYGAATYTISMQSNAAGWIQTGQAQTVSLTDAGNDTVANFGSVCTVQNHGGAETKYWAGSKGKAVLMANDAAWRTLLTSTLNLTNADGSRFTVSGKPSQAYDQLKKWLGKASVSTQLAAAALNVKFGTQDGSVRVHDAIAGDWPSVNALIARVSALSGNAAAAYRGLIEKLNGDAVAVTPASAAGCGAI